MALNNSPSPLLNKEDKFQALSALVIMLLVQIPVDIFFYILYQPYIIRPYTNMVYFFILCIIGYILANKYGRLTYLYVKDLSGILAVALSSISMILIYLVLKFREIIFKKLTVFNKIQDLEPGRWQFFTKPWNEINIFISVAGIFLVVLGMEIFYRSYIQELLNKYMVQTKAIVCMAVLSGLHTAVLGPVSGIVDFFLALIWGLVYARAGLYGSVFVHMVWDILFIYFPGK
ncbi:MAG: CPBP family intramembrane metalloprotease [Candidatus Firestonebacteria bacterium]|nr:CPBP family intramembrane metalloprotease [Candidatus Firestonebacteria bacterium]